MGRPLTWFVSLVVLVGVTVLADEPGAKRPDGREVDGRQVKTYTKTFNDNYGIYHKEVYQAYTKLLKDEKGEEVLVEIWHGRATGLHENGSKAWEVEYRHGKREGVSTTWSDDGIKTGLATFRHGLVEGKSYQWHRDGRKMTEQTYEHDKLNGETCWWDTEGKILAQGIYRDGQPWTGTFPEWVTPPKNSSFAVLRQYEAGEKVSEKRLTANWWW